MRKITHKMTGTMSLWFGRASLILGMLALMISAAHAQTPQYTFTNGATGTNSIPFGGGSWSDQRNQWFYAPGDFGSVPSGMAITKFYLRAGTVLNATTWTNLTIKMGQPNITGLTSSWVTGLTTVYSVSSHSQSLPTTNQWIVFTLQTPFPYNPNLPLVVETIQTATSGGIGFLAGGTPVNTAYTGNTQTYGASTAASGNTRRYSYAAGIDLKSLLSDNAGVQSVTPATFCSGSQSVSTVIENSGTNKIDSIRVSWSLDGVFQNTIYYKTAIDTMGNANGNTKTVSLGTVSFSSGISRTIKVWTSFPNGRSDKDKTNDTLVVTRRPALGGTFTINKNGSGATNFTSFALAVAALNSYGVCGPVTFNVAADNYNEAVTMNAIAGVSATNSITFKGAGKFSTRLYNSGSYPLYLNGAKYIRFEDMTFECTGTTYSMYLLNADYSYFKNCRMLANQTSSASYNIYNYTGNNITFENNIITGGYYGVYDYGATGYNYSGNKYLNNRITKQYYYGMMMYYRYKDVYDGNYVDSMGGGSGYPLYIYYCGGVTVRNNIVGPTGSYANYFYYPNNYGSTTKYEVYNNIFNMNNTISYYPVYMYGTSTNISFLHNTVYKGAYSSGYGMYLNAAVGGMDFRNNTLTVKGGTYGIYIATTTMFSKFEYNNFDFSGVGSGYAYYGTVVANFAAFQAALLTNKYGAGNNTVAMPFKSATDLHLDQTKPAPAGKSVGITTDIDGDARCLLFPTIGADESTVGKTNFTGNFSGPDTVFSGSPTVFFNSAKEGEPKVFRWYINGVKVAGKAGDSIHLYTTNITGTTATISLVTIGCAKTDSVTKTVIVVLPTKRPVVDFIGTSYLIRKGQTVKFTDLSTNGPSQWQWAISPVNYTVNGVPTPRYKYVYGTDKTPINEVQFNAAGKYTVCLTASNSVGAGASVCKQAYVEVIEEINMCQTAVTRLDKGYLYDDGGPLGNYTPGTKCGMQIAPCADTIYFVLKNFNTYYYDYLRIYDGKDNKGKPLHAIKCSNLGYAGGATYTSPSCRPATGGDTLMAVSGSMYIEFDATYTGNTNQPGFEAYWYSLPKTNVAAPKAFFVAPDTVCVNTVSNFKSQSTGSFLQYMWDLDGDPTTLEDDAESTQAAFFALGNQTVRLIVQNCAGTDTFVKNIYVKIAPTPMAAFSADNTNPVLSDVVTLFNTTKECVDNVEWTISGPGAVKFQPGFDKFSFNPKVTFGDTGCYSVTLKVYNSSSVGSGIAFKNCYIKVKGDYCKPGAATLIPDVGISRVKFADLNSSSDVAKTDYTNYTGSRSARVEKGRTYGLTVERIATANAMTRTAWIDWNGDGDFTDAGEMLGEERNAKTLSWTTNVTIPNSAKDGATVMRVATNFGNLNNLVCGQNQYGEFEDYRIYIGPITTPPTITLKGADTVYLEQNYTYNDSGATAVNALGTNISNLITVSFTPKFFQGIAGTYTETYSVTDPVSGLKASKNRIVVVIPDRIAPFLTVNSTDTIYVTVKTSFTPPTATAVDSVDGILTSQINKSYNPAFDINKVGTYLLTYSVSDASNNTSSKTIVIIVRDDVKPVIKMNGTDTVTVEACASFTDPGATATDNYDATINVTATSNVDASKAGTYTIVYSAKDAAGNAADNKTRTVIVKDTKAPALALVGADSMTIDANVAFNDPGVTVNDDCGRMTAKDVVKTGTFVSNFPNMIPNLLGRFTIIYTITDAAGNKSTVTRTLNVVDKTKPVITLKGLRVVDTVCRWSTYKDAGYDLSDNFYPESQINVTMESTRTDSTQRIGVWAIRYKAEDPSGNVAYSEYRLMNITQCVSGIEETEISGNRVSIYPNPSTGKFTIEVNLPQHEYVKISVLNMLGQEVRAVNSSNMINGKFPVDLTTEKAGMYFINITSNGNTITKKVNLIK